MYFEKVTSLEIEPLFCHFFFIKCSLSRTVYKVTICDFNGYCISTLECEDDMLARPLAIALPGD